VNQNRFTPYREDSLPLAEGASVNYQPHSGWIFLSREAGKEKDTPVKTSFRVIPVHNAGFWITQ
jgi:hypothetical protein